VTSSLLDEIFARHRPDVWGQRVIATMPEAIAPPQYNGLGPAVVNGELQFTSISQLEKSDPNSEGGCLRRWFIRYVLRQKEDDTEQMAAGGEIHEQIDRYVTTGEDVLGRVASAARPFIPRRGADLRAELQIYKPGTDQAVLTCAGVPVTGKIDLVHTRGEYITPMGTLERDPEGTGEYVDWKSKGKLRGSKGEVYTKTGPDLVKLIQMPTYAEWGFREYPTLEHARLSHVYLQRNGAADSLKATTLVDRERIARRWESIEGLGRRIVHAARETDPNVIEPNPRACKAFNRQCGYTGKQCHLSDSQTLSSIFGPRGADRLMSAQIPTFPPFAPGAGPGPFNPQAAGEPAAVFSASALLGALQPAAPAAPAGPALTADFKDAVATIRGAKLADGTSAGFPPLKGEAALHYAALLNAEGTGHAVTDKPFAGKDRLGGIDAVDTVAAFQALAAQLVQNGFAAPVKYVAAAAAPAVPVPAAAPPPVNPLAGVFGILPADAPASQPALAADAPKTEEPAAAAPAAEKPKRGRPPKAQEPAAAAPAPQIPVSINAAPPSMPEAVSTQVVTTGIVLGIDARPSTPHHDLDAYVHGLHVALIEHMHLKPDDFKDIRCSSDDRLTFGKWKGTLAAFVRERPPAPGVYFIDTRDELSAVVAEALRPMASMCFRGVR